MVLRPICEPVELPIGASVIAERVKVAPEAAQIGRFMHFHDVAELVIFGPVSGDFFAEGRRHALQHGSIVFIPSMRHHDYALERGAMEWLLVQIDPYIVETIAFRADLAALARPFCIVPDRRARARIEMLGDWLIEAAADGERAAAVERIVELLLIAAAHAPGEQPVGSPDITGHAERLLPALERLRTAPAEPLSLSRAATLCRLSATYFSRRFRQLFGMTFSHYSRIYRLHLAARRLAGSATPISEIAFGVGFSNPAHFTARFRERFGMTPRAYRASARTRSARGGESNEPD